MENSAVGPEVQAATNTNPYAMAYPAVQEAPSVAAPVHQSVPAVQPAAVVTPIACAKCNIDKQGKGKIGMSLMNPRFLPRESTGSYVAS